MECIFCRIIRGEISSNFIHSDELAVVFPDHRPKAATHLLIVPRLHITSLLASRRPEHQEILGHLLLLTAEIAAKFQLDGYKTIINTGASGGQEVWHLHLHFLSNSSMTIPE